MVNDDWIISVLPLIHCTNLKEILVILTRNRKNWLTERKFRRSHSGADADPITVGQWAVSICKQLPMLTANS
jgi:hypothetical protein